MDFTTTEAAHDLGGLVDTIVDAVCTPEHQRELDGLDQRFDRGLWGKLIESDILTSAAPASLGGDGFGVLEQVAVLVALGHQLAAVPYLESAVLAAGALARFGSEELQRSWGAPAVRGEKILTVALDGEMGEGPVQAVSAGGAVAGYRLTGTRTRVGFGPVSDAFLVPAETDSGTAVFVVAVQEQQVSGWGSRGELGLGKNDCLLGSEPFEVHDANRSDDRRAGRRECTESCDGTAPIRAVFEHRESMLRAQ